MASMSHHCSIFCKSLIFRNHLEQLLLQRAPRNVSFLLHRRLTHLPLLLLSDNIPFPSYSLPIRHSILLPSTPISPLLPPRTPPRSSPMSSLTTPPPPPPDSNSNPNPNPVTKTDRVVIKGRVQGVFYRDWTVQNATELGLKGWVRNRRDGSVEALFSGPPEKVQEMEQRCRRGPPSAAVTGFQAFPGNHDDPGTGFERRPTV